jgi:hypothetical protein
MCGHAAASISQYQMQPKYRHLSVYSPVYLKSMSYSIDSMYRNLRVKKFKTDLICYFYMRLFGHLLAVLTRKAVTPFINLYVRLCVNQQNVTQNATSSYVLIRVPLYLTGASLSLFTITL